MPLTVYHFVLQIYDRDGLTLGEFVKGDMYIRDLKNTKGHISGLTCGEWHPRTKETILTSSEDGSLRIWDVNDFNSQKQVSIPRSLAGCIIISKRLKLDKFFFPSFVRGTISDAQFSSILLSYR